MDTKAIKPGDYVDVRMVAVEVGNRGATVRLLDHRAVHQFEIDAHQIVGTAERSPDAIAADVVCSSYDGRAPLALRRR